MPRSIVFACVLLVAGCAKPPDQSAEVKRLTEKANAFEADSVKVRAEYAKLESQLAQADQELARLKGQAVNQPQLPTLLRDVKIVSPVGPRPPENTLAYFQIQKDLEIGQVGYIKVNKGTLTRVKDVISDEYMAIETGFELNKILILYTPTTGITSGKVMFFPGVWKVVGTIRYAGAVRHLLHYVAP